MIYINDKRITREELAELTKPLQEFAPHFFKEDSPKGVQISYSPMAMTPRERSAGLGSRAARSIVMGAPEPTSVKTKSYRITKDGMREDIVYSETAPYEDKSGRKRYKGATIILAHDTFLRPVQDLEKFVYLYHFSGMFNNGVNGRSSSRFTFVIPDLINKLRVEDTNARKRNALEGAILFGGLTIDKVKTIMTAMNLPVEGSDDTNRTRLFDFIVKGKDVFNDGAYEQYVSLTSGNANAAKVSEVTQFVNLALTDGKIVESENGWCFVGKTGAGRPFAPIDQNDKEASLIQAIVSDEKLIQRLEKTLEGIA